MEIRTGKIIKWDRDGCTVFVPFDGAGAERAALRQYDTVEVGLPDGRTIMPEQRMKAYALMGEIAEWSGHTPTEVKLIHKWEFVNNHLAGLHKALFSLSDCDVTTAREFISYLIDFIIEFGVPTKRPLSELCDDIQRYVYACLTHKVCCICGKPACVHHCGITDEHASNKIGMGGNRKTQIHEGLIVMPLCWGVGSHHNEAHQIEQEAFEAKYHIGGIPATKEICKAWGLKCLAE